MSGRAACVPVERSLGVRGTWCFWAGDLPVLLLGLATDKHTGWEHSCMLAPIPILRLSLKHSECNSFLSLSKAFSRRHFACYSVAISTASCGEREAVVLLYRHAGEQRAAGWIYARW